MNKIFTFLFTAFFTICTPLLLQAGSLPVTLKIPEEVLIEAIQKSLPIEIDTSSESIGGSVFIRSIENIQLENQNVMALLKLSGKDMKINTNIAGHKLKLNIGDVQLDFNIAALLRFDEPSQTLFIKPAVSEVPPDSNNKGSELGVLLVGLFNGNEFPVEIAKLQPIITDLGTKELAIALKIQDIKVKKDRLLLELQPDIKASATRAQ